MHEILRQKETDRQTYRDRGTEKERDRGRERGANKLDIFSYSSQLKEIFIKLRLQAVRDPRRKFKYSGRTH